jgi:type II restriction enzyme
MSDELKAAKQALDAVIKKSRVHLYKPIQIAEILYRHRTQCNGSLNLLKLEAYRNPSKRWRDDICEKFLGRVSTSSARYQDNVFEENAIPPRLLAILGEENKIDGRVEAYIYQAFEEKHNQLENALNYCLKSTKESFDVQLFIGQFYQQAGLKRSLDKIFEMVVYALFEALTTAIDVKLDIYYDKKSIRLLQEFATFAEKVLNLSAACDRKTMDAHFHRVGVTNAADRGLDMYANFGSVVQIKHLSLDEELAENVVTSITSERIIIVCKDSEERVIQSLLAQIGWRSRIQAVITLNELASWYNTALNGAHAEILGDRIIHMLSDEIQREFPSVGSDDFYQFKLDRGYNQITNSYWTANSC